MTLETNLPRGVQAFVFEGAERRREAEACAVSVLERAGLREVILPVLDFASPYSGLEKEESFGSYRFVDRQGELLALRSDFTPLAARVLAPRLQTVGLPVEFFYRGDIVRDQESGIGRLREFSQVGAERYGDPDFSADRRMLRLLIECLSGVPAPALILTLGYAGLLEKLLAAVAPSLTAGNGRPFANVVKAARERRVTFVEKKLAEARVKREIAAEIGASLIAGFNLDSPLFSYPVLTSGVHALRVAREEAQSAMPGLSVIADLAGTPGAAYYTGLTFGLDMKGVAAPLASGGRYDGLLEQFGVSAPAVGFCIGVEALTMAREALRDDAPIEKPLRIAMGKGRLLPKALAGLREAGIDFPESDGRRLLLSDPSGRYELLLLKDDDVPTYVAHGGADLGIVGSDRVEESAEPVFCPVELPFGECRLSLITREGEEFRPNGHPVTVGTKYVRLAGRFFDQKRITHEIVPLAGSVELAAALKLTDAVVDLIETGSTMKANGLEEKETIMRSQACLIAGRHALTSFRGELARITACLSRKAITAC